MAHRRTVGRTLIVKLASRCNLYCTYCYWFRDAAVDDLPALLTTEARNALPKALRDHVEWLGDGVLSVVFHGGEPLLFGKDRFSALCDDIRSAAGADRDRIRFSMTTNAVLMDRDWCEIFQREGVGIAVSIDGPKAVHDAARVTRKGQGSFDAMRRGVACLQAAGISPMALAVAQPDTNPADLLATVFDDIGLTSLDVLFPDATHDAPPPPVAGYYVDLFDAWYDRYLARGCRLRIFDVLLNRMLGGDRANDIFGPKHSDTLTILPDGRIDITDVINAIGGWEAAPAVDASLDTGVASVCRSARFRQFAAAADSLCATCAGCDISLLCGGGHVVSRWKAESGFDNPSVYCRDIKAIVDHVWARLKPSLQVAALA